MTFKRLIIAFYERMAEEDETTFLQFILGSCQNQQRNFGFFKKIPFLNINPLEKDLKKLTG